MRRSQFRPARPIRSSPQEDRPILVMSVGVGNQCLEQQVTDEQTTCGSDAGWDGKAVRQPDEWLIEDHEDTIQSVLSDAEIAALLWVVRIVFLQQLISVDQAAVGVLVGEIT